MRKDDLELALKHYPNAKRILNAKASKLMKEKADKNKKDEKESKDVLFRSDSHTDKDPALLGAIRNIVAAKSLTNIFPQEEKEVSQ